MQQTVERYRQFLEESEHSAATIEKYLRDINRYFRDTCPEDRMTHTVVVQWRDGLVRQGYAPTSVNAMLASVNGYFAFCGCRDCCAKPLKVQRKAFCDPGRELTRKEYCRLLETAKTHNKRRLYLVLQTLASTGIRVSELQFITVEALRRGHASVRCKGKCREIFLPKTLCTKLKKWCGRCHRHTGAVFTTRSGNPLDRSNLWREMKALCILAGISGSKVFPHNLRHLFARSFYEMDKDLSKLADLLGHSSVETTRIYILESGREHQRLIERLHLLL